MFLLSLVSLVYFLHLKEPLLTQNVSIHWELLAQFIDKTFPLLFLSTVGLIYRFCCLDMNRVVGKRPLSWAASGSKKALVSNFKKKKRKKVSKATEKLYLATTYLLPKKKKRRKVNIETVSLESNVPPCNPSELCSQLRNRHSSCTQPVQS